MLVTELAVFHLIDGKMWLIGIVDRCGLAAMRAEIEVRLEAATDLDTQRGDL